MPLETITEIDLDTNQPGVSIVHAKQYDTARKVRCNLFYSGMKWLVPSSNIEAVVGFKKADRIGGFYDETEDGETAITVDNEDRSIIYVILDRNVVTTEGNVNTEITFYDAVTRGRLSTFSFIVQVEEASITELDLASNPYFNVLAEDITAVLNAEANITGLTATATSRAEGSSPTVTVTGGSGGVPYNIAFGIPKGDKGNTGDTATPGNTEYSYAVSTSGTTVPSSGWGTPTPQKGKYFWTRAKTTWSNNTTTTTYAVAYIGTDGSGSVNSVNNKVGNVVLSASDIDLQNGTSLQEEAENKILYFDNVTCSATTGNFVSLSNSQITSDHVLLECVFTNPVFIITDTTWTTGNGSLTLNGTCTTATTARIVLGKKNN